MFRIQATTPNAHINYPSASHPAHINVGKSGKTNFPLVHSPQNKGKSAINTRVNTHLPLLPLWGLEVSLRRCLTDTFALWDPELRGGLPPLPGSSVSQRW
jgi:hypothetical protein